MSGYSQKTLAISGRYTVPVFVKEKANISFSMHMVYMTDFMIRVILILSKKP